MEFESLRLAQEGWTEEDIKNFEIAIATYDKDTPYRWPKVAAMVPGKTVSEVIRRYKKREHDIREIEAVLFDDLEYPSSSSTFEHADNHISDACNDACIKRPATAVTSSDQERKKGVPCTEEEDKELKLETEEWTKEENKIFESAIAMYDKDTPNRWLKVAAMVPGKTVSDLIKQYEKLEHDISEIEAGRVPDPQYPDNPMRAAYRKRLATHVNRRRRRGAYSNIMGRRGPLGQEEH